MRGATTHPADQLVRMFISIHAPHAGRDIYASKLGDIFN